MGRDNREKMKKIAAKRGARRIVSNKERGARKHEFALEKTRFQRRLDSLGDGYKTKWDRWE